MERRSWAEPQRLSLEEQRQSEWEEAGQQQEGWRVVLWFSSLTPCKNDWYQHTVAAPQHTTMLPGKPLDKSLSGDAQLWCVWGGNEGTLQAILKSDLSAALYLASSQRSVCLYFRQCSPVLRDSVHDEFEVFLIQSLFLENPSLRHFPTISIALCPIILHFYEIIWINKVVLVLCRSLLFLAKPTACGNSWAKDQTHAIAETRATAVTASGP